MTQHHITLADNQRNLDVQAGDKITIELGELACAGFEWELVETPPEVSTQIERPPAPPGALGAEAPFVMHLHVAQRSNGTLRLAQRQPWTSSTADDLWFVLHLHVRS